MKQDSANKGMSSHIPLLLHDLYIAFIPHQIRFHRLAVLLLKYGLYNRPDKTPKNFLKDVIKYPELLYPTRICNFIYFRRALEQ